MAYPVFALTKVARDQGEWAAANALQILRGKTPARIPVARNTQTEAWLNPALAQQTVFHAAPEFLARRHRVD